MKDEKNSTHVTTPPPCRTLSFSKVQPSSVRHRVFASCDIGPEALRKLEERGCQVEVHAGLEPPSASVLVQKFASGIDGLISSTRDPLTAGVLEVAARHGLRVIAQYGVGIDNVDREAANRLRIPFTNTADVVTHATAEFALFMLGCLSRRMYPSERLVREGRWNHWHPFLPFLGDEVTGKTVSVIGAGRIGKAFALKCAGLEMDLICVCRRGDDPKFRSAVQELMDFKHRTGLVRRRPTIRYAPLEEALAGGDFVSLHVPLAQQTRHLIGEGALRRMKPTAFLINASRGAVVDEAALCLALKERWIAGAALDVFEREPLPPDSPLLDPELEDRLRLFHHIGSGTRETRLSIDPERGMAGRCAEGLLQILEGKHPSQVPYVVNKEAFS